MVSYLPAATAVTDAELEALEKQIEQQEAEEIKQTEAEKKKNAEAAAKRKAEAEKKLAEDQKRKEEEKEKRKAEKERLRVEQEANAKAEAEAQRREEVKREQFSRYVKNGDSEMNNKEYAEALRAYTQALEVYPNDSKALSGQSRAREFKDNCTALVGEWDWILGSSTIVSADGQLQNIALIPNHGSWECTDPSQRKFTLRWVIGGWVDNITLSADGNKVDAFNNIGLRFQAWRKGTKKAQPTREIPL
jgi:tetratricopeptide (TPR) repeat protein